MTTSVSAVGPPTRRPDCEVGHDSELPHLPLVLAAAFPEDIRAVDRAPSRLNPDPAPAPLPFPQPARRPGGLVAKSALLKTTCTHELPRWIPRMCDPEC